MEWDENFIKNIEKKFGDNLERAAIHLKNRIKENINRSQPHSGTGLAIKGLDPSLDDEPPKKVTGFLQRSIAHEMSADRQTAYVGSNLDKALFLELGTSRMAARPFLRSTLIQEQDNIMKIVTKE